MNPNRDTNITNILVTDSLLVLDYNGFESPWVVDYTNGFEPPWVLDYTNGFDSLLVLDSLL